MIVQRIEEHLQLFYSKKIMVFDFKGFRQAYDYFGILEKHDYRIYQYDDAIHFRILYEDEIKPSEDKLAIVVTKNSYVPFDIRRGFAEITLSFPLLFPKLNGDTVAKYYQDLDIISFAYSNYYGTRLNTQDRTESFIIENVFTAENVKKYSEGGINTIRNAIDSAKTWQEWSDIAKAKAKIEYYGTRVGISFDWSFIDDQFSEFLLNSYGKLAGELSKTSPPILSKTLQLLADNRRKLALIVMDGMSLFDFETISRHLPGMFFDVNTSFALIPTITSISRQCLLSGRFPLELKSIISQSGEEGEFKRALSDLGYSDNQIEYLRGEDEDPSPFTKFAAIIINEIDYEIHSQRKGRVGMIYDTENYTKKGVFQKLLHRLYNAGFDIYITSDHGNTMCTGVGILRGLGVLVETKSKRVIILKDIGEANELILENAVEFPALYLDEKFKYFVCKNGVSFNKKSVSVMSHGGISIDEVIVPFVHIKAVK